MERFDGSPITALGDDKLGVIGSEGLLRPDGALNDKEAAVVLNEARGNIDGTVPLDVPLVQIIDDDPSIAGLIRNALKEAA